MHMGKGDIFHSAEVFLSRQDLIYDTIARIHQHMAVRAPFHQNGWVMSRQIGAGRAGAEKRNLKQFIVHFFRLRGNMRFKPRAPNLSSIPAIPVATDRFL